MDPEMHDHGATPEMAIYCFDVLLASLTNKSQPRVPSSIPNDKLLHEGLAEYSVTSALNDSRFNPITLKEMPDLHCSFEPAKNYMDWTVGIHGIRINYYGGQRQYSAVYLPEVAHEQGWDHLETIDSLIRKGGYNGHIDEAFRMAVNVTRFQSSKVSVSHEDYLNQKRHH